MEKITGKFVNNKLSYYLLIATTIFIITSLFSSVGICYSYIQRIAPVKIGFEKDEKGEDLFWFPKYEDAPPLDFGEKLYFYVLPLCLFGCLSCLLIYTITISKRKIPITFAFENTCFTATFFEGTPKKEIKYLLHSYSFVQRNPVFNGRPPISRQLIELRFVYNSSYIIITEDVLEGTNPGLPMYSGDSRYVENYSSREPGTLLKVADMLKSKHVVSGGV